jgi:hypothetical protein
VYKDSTPPREGLVASVPERHTARLRDGMHTSDLPVAAQALTVSMMWQPRMEADPAHRWLRRRVHELCAGGPAGES